VTPHDDRLALAETFLREAVYRARERQSAVAALHVSATGNCGLGERAVAVLDLSPRAREILAELGSGDLEYSTVNGSIEIEVPSNLDADLDMRTVNGSLTSDFELKIEGRVNPRRMRATIGKGGRRLRLETVNGSVELRKAS